MSSKKFKNIKNGNFYELVLENVINCTNANDGEVMVLYKSLDKPNMIFVREKQEFYVKFQQCE